MGGVLHLDLETIALETHFIKRDGLKYASAITFEACCGVVNFKACDETHVFGGELAHQHTTDGPVNNVHTTNIARTNGHVVALVVACSV